MKQIQVTVEPQTAFTKIATDSKTWHAGCCRCPFCGEQADVWAPRPQGLAWAIGCRHVLGAADGGEITVIFEN